MKTNRSPFSQYNQDVWALNKLSNKKGGFFVEVGAFQFPDGRMSNTLLLERDYKWGGILIEPSKNTFKNLSSRRCHKINAAASNKDGFLNFKHGNTGATSKVSNDGDATKCYTLNSILNIFSAPKVIDFLSIDVEGHEESVLEGIDFNSRQFLCVTIEHALSNAKNIKSILEKNNFTLDKELKYDYFFVNRDLIEPKHL